MRPSASGGDRAIDPVVARLKAARKAEREKLELMKREKKGIPPKKKPSGTSKSVSPASQNVKGINNNRKDTKKAPLRTNNTWATPTSSARENIEKKPKMSFAQLMQKASSIDQTRLSIEIKGNKAQEDLSRRSISNKPHYTHPLSQRNSNPSNSTQKAPSTGKRPNIDSHGQQRSVKNSMHIRLNNAEIINKRDHRNTEPAPISRAPLPIRKPSSQLQERLKKSGRLVQSSKNNSFLGRDSHSDRHNNGHNDSEDEDDDDDLDSFIASDEELEEEAADYDRDEIWSMFNRGRKRTYYNHADSDSDDMEATGAEILAEEARSKRNALEEDRRELEEEERLAALKRARKMKKGH